ncbi:sugar phosphate isomerase/epimerase [Nakamurella sp. UYEF19]
MCDDPIDSRHQAILLPQVWGDGDAKGVRQRAAHEMKLTARAAAGLGVDTVVGFTGSSIWKYVAMFPPVSQSLIDAGYQDFADRWNPILDVFDEVGVRFAHEVHPSEIAYDYWTTVAAMDAIGHREAFRLNWDPSHFLSGRILIRSDFCGTSRTGSTTSIARTRNVRSAMATTAAGLPPGLGRSSTRLGLRVHRPW